MKLTKDLVTGAIAVVLFTVLLGVAYPLAVIAISQVVFPGKADGSLIHHDGAVAGSRLLGAPRTIGKRSDPAYFAPRPSATGYSASATYFSNRGPNSSAARFFYRDAVASYLAREGRYNPGLAKDDVPVDAVTTSASGVDPHISPRNAAIQARRVAAVRKVSVARIDRVVDADTDHRFLGVVGEPGVNVTEVNLALDKEAPNR